MRQVIAASMIVFFEGLVLWTVVPIMTFYVDELGGDAVWLGIMFMLMSLPRLISNPIIGRLSDRFGRRPLVIASSIGAILASVVWALAPSVGWLAVSRGLAGFFAAQATLCSATIADVTTPEKRGSAMGILGAGFAFSMVIGPLAGGFIARHASHAAVGWFAAGTQILTLMTALFVLRDIAKPAAGGASVARARRSYAQVIVLAGVPALLFVTFCLTLGQSQVTTVFSRLIDVAYGMTEKDAGYLFAFLGLIGTLVQGGAIRTLLPRYGDLKVAAGGFVLVAIGTAAITIHPPTWALWLSLGTIGAGTALSAPTVTALVSRCVDEDSQGTLMGVHQAVTSLGRSCGALTAGFLFGRVAMWSPFALAMGVSLIAAMILIVSRRKTAA